MSTKSPSRQRKRSLKLTELQDLFVIKHGTKLDLNKMEECGAEQDAIAFVNRSGMNYGVVGLVKRIPALDPYPAGSITVALGGSALASFVQPRPFYTAQNIDVLYPRTEMSNEVKLYYCLCIEANRFRYSTFGREANRTLKTLLVPELKLVPEWVHGTTPKAVEALSRDLKAVLAAESPL